MRGVRDARGKGPVTGAQAFFGVPYRNDPRSKSRKKGKIALARAKLPRSGLRVARGKTESVRHRRDLLDSEK